jgi:SAM-dependent methyltransferase
VNAKEALLSVEEIVRQHGDSKALGTYFMEFRRRLEVLRLVERYCSRDAAVVDLGAQPLIVSSAHRAIGYDVTAVDVEPEPHMPIAERCGVRVIRRDLERERLDVRGADCAVFTEVIEHLHYYYVPQVLSEINKSLKPGGYLILTTPNIASLLRRLRLLLGRQPIYLYHVREYTTS